MNAEYGDRGLISRAVHPGSVMNGAGGNMLEEKNGLLVDKAELMFGGDTIVWSTLVGRECFFWAGGKVCELHVGLVECKDAGIVCGLYPMDKKR